MVIGVSPSASEDVLDELVAVLGTTAC